MVTVVGSGTWDHMVVCSVSGFEMRFVVAFYGKCIG